VRRSGRAGLGGGLEEERDGLQQGLVPRLLDGGDAPLGVAAADERVGGQLARAAARLLGEVLFDYFTRAARAYQEAAADLPDA
jgi:hypothetical protein